LSIHPSCTKSHFIIKPIPASYIKFIVLHLPVYKKNPPTYSSIHPQSHLCMHSSVGPSFRTSIHQSIHPTFHTSIHQLSWFSGVLHAVVWAKNTLLARPYLSVTFYLWTRQLHDPRSLLEHNIATVRT
jgi:hypothetical protein